MRKLTTLALAVLLASCATVIRAQSPEARAVLNATTCPATSAAATGCVRLSVAGLSGVAVQVTGTYVGTLTFEVSLDGVTYSTLSLTPPNSTTSVTSPAGNATGIWGGAVGGAAVVQIRMSAYMSGAATVTIKAAPMSGRGSGLGGGGGGSPGGSDTQVQFNDSGAFGGDTGLVWDKTANQLTVTGADPGVMINASGLYQNFGSALYVDARSSDTTETVQVRAAQFLSTATNATGITEDIFGIDVLSQQTGNGNVDDVFGVRTTAKSSGSGTVGTLNGEEVILSTAGTTTTITGWADSVQLNGGVTTTRNGIHLANVGTQNGATLTNNYGLVIDPLTTGGTVNTAIKTGAGLLDFGDSIQLATGKALKTDTTAAHTVLLQAYDTDTGPAYVTFATLTNGTAPSFAIAPPAGGGTVSVTAAYTTTGSGLSVANVGSNSCGTTAATIAGNPNTFEITVGATAGTQCRVTFPTAAPTRMNCTVTDSTTTIATRATSVDTTHVDFLGAFVAGDVVTAMCFPR